MTQPQTASTQAVVITGASSGIGKASAEAFARMGWHVIGVGRDPQRCADAEEAIRAVAAPAARVDFLRGDFTEMADVRRVAGEIASLTDRLDVLVNNAGGVRDARYRTSEGLEATFAANHLAPFLLTRELLPLLEKTAAESPEGTVRVIAVSSSGHMGCPGMRWDDLMMFGDENFGPAVAYCQAKLANLLFTRELDRRLADKGIIAQAMHPGRVGSNFASHGDDTMKAYMAANECVAPESPARTIVWMAIAPELGRDGGRYFHDLAEEEPAPQARDDEAAARLWRESERILDTIG
ncbi:SDR family NAD(P)-dependent oxidoreductase [Novosphingobium mangrovi (ex Huang et al. 2023)]|uniref:SDR family NAD(P)-dependent oxidoreductase n=1 Tax=Novosphingobium mangrovi (ex Huang et al. 2023) TaxID=2976432 RepID=A0ABT2I3T2_9SPHN|nr:SDR family NAD(P)-dependent oxidoreductase [Novosphingobium mangrovi (ex Huang et al. 2023)]MCT2399472.1 SDR family NAD(P)-dependent oxidoreductase [Novosphingobium mangrovi (ex Huang et al. 2023)]